MGASRLRPRSAVRSTARTPSPAPLPVGKLLRRNSYADESKPRPFYRGVLHLCLTVALALGCIAVTLAVATRAVSPVYTSGVWFLLGKCLSLGASAFLHVFPHASIKSATSALIWDLLLVPVSIWATVVPFTPAHQWLTFFIGASFTLATFQLVRYQFDGHVGLDTPTHKSDAPRTVVIVVEFLWATGTIGWARGFSDYWITGFLLYMLAFFVSIPVTAAHDKEPLSKMVPWHRPSLNSFHEDFHLLLFGADFCFGVMAVQFLNALANA